MSNSTDIYINGMKSFESFFDMLHLAMLEAMPGVEISGSGAYVWRAYRIDSYKDWAKGVFYFQIYPDNPHVLIFKEGYLFPKYKPRDPGGNDEKYGIKNGSYYYPFWITLDLYKSRFFLFSASEQYEILRNFVSYAVAQAQIWQTSSVRTRPDITSKEYLRGNEKIKANSLSKPKGYGQVSIDYLKIFEMQKELFNRLGSILKSDLGNDIKWLPNANWRNWDFRGHRLFISPGDSADYVWEIYYQKPEKLKCFSYESGHRKREGYLDIQSTQYFDQSDEKKKLLLEEFVKNTTRGIRL